MPMPMQRRTLPSRAVPLFLGAAALALAALAPHRAMVSATLTQNRLYSDDMILESREAYDIRPFISGFGDTAGEKLTVSFAGHKYPTSVVNGTWEVQMNCCDKLTDQVLTVEGESNTLTYKNVACGQVFVCSGQSNMELPLSYVIGGAEEIANANRPNWRLFRVPHNTATTPQDDMAAVDKDTKLPAKWLVSNSTVAAKFSATCYLTARHVADMWWGDAPIGLIWSSWGGTRVEAWAPASTVAQCPSAAHEAPMAGPQAYSQLYNAMIHPLTKFSIRGAFWFQGEHNVVTDSTRQSYACIFGAMINSWRDAWTGIGDFPFMWAQLAPYTGYANRAGKGDVSIVRLAQADDLPHIGLDTTGMAVTIDLGDPKAPAGDVHSRQKDPVAYRLALQAMHAAYAYQDGENVTNHDHPELTPHPFPLHFSGPLLTTAAHHTALHATLRFDFGDGLYLNDTMGCAIHRGVNFANQPIGGECCAAKDTFQLCTGDLANTTALVCVNASTVTLDGASGEVSLGWAAAGTDSDGATYGEGSFTPTSVRYAYANYPQCALYNQHALPAGPFVAVLLPADAREGMHLAKGGNTPPVTTPPMGVNSWNAFHCNVDERKMRAMADALVSTGLAKAGFEFVNIDDCWQVMRSPNGTINADPERFPGGMKSLADYIHSKGLKFGVYTAQHQFTCQRRPGSYLHEAIDVESYCAWGVDYLKLDACSGKSYPQHNTSWIKFRAAIDACSARRGFPMVLSVESCDDPTGCGTWIGELANLWRTCGDIQATFASVMRNVAENTRMAKWAGPTGGPLGGGHWNDADMLQVGDIGLSITEQYSHFALWCIMASPLLVGSDVSMLTPTSLLILGNEEATAVNQDKLGVQGVPVASQAKDAATASCWFKTLAGGSVAAILLNTGDQAATITCDLSEFGLKHGAAAKMRDLWTHKDLAVPGGGKVGAKLASHAHKFYVFTTK